MGSLPTTESAAVYLALADDKLLEQCEMDHYRASGPGGQKRNKTSSAVRLRHIPTGLAASAADDRSQNVNRGRALRRLRGAIALNLRAVVDLEAFRPSEVMAGCLRDGGEIAVGLRDPRYFIVVAEILDLLVGCGMSVRDAAAHLGVSTARLVKFLQRDSKLWERVNALRAQAGLKALR